MTGIIVSILLCLAAFLWLLQILRHDRVSFGLPVAYLFGLLLIHVPGAYAHFVGGDVLFDTVSTEIGIRFTAIGSVCFVVGVYVARKVSPESPVRGVAPRREFWLFCLFAGWVVVYGLSFLNAIPTLGAAVQKGGALWMLGVLLGLRSSMQRGDAQSAALWLSALAVYPVLMLILGGFLSYGTAAIIVVLSALTVSARGYWRTLIGICTAALFAVNIFLNYFESRSEIRDAVWGGASIEKRMEVSLGIFNEFEWFDSSNPEQLRSLDARLNQNYFVGLAASRIENGQVDYLYGRSVWEGLLALVPRIAWPDKPVFGGSPKIVSEMTGLYLSESTSFGVGNVMEFQINFGTAGVMGGFLLLGLALGVLDRKAAAAEIRGDLGRVILFFLPAVALIQPNGSMVEMAGGSAAALVAAFGWQLLWKRRARKMADRSGLKRNFSIQRV